MALYRGDHHGFNPPMEDHQMHVHNTWCFRSSSMKLGLWLVGWCPSLFEGQVWVRWSGVNPQQFDLVGVFMTFYWEGSHILVELAWLMQQYRSCDISICGGLLIK